MARPLSHDLRARMIKAVGSGLTARAAARQCDVAASTGIKLVKRWRETGSFEARKMGGHRVCILDKARACIEAMLREHGDWTETERAAHLEQRRGIKVASTTVGRFVRRQGLSYTKKRARRRAGTC